MLKKIPIHSILLLLMIVFGENPYIFSQEEDDYNTVEKRAAWFYIQRSHPYDTIPSYGYANAMEEKGDLISNNGYQVTGPGSGWVNMGPKPLYGIGGIASGRISALLYDHRDNTGNTFYIAPAGGGVWKTTNSGTNWQDISNNLLTLVSGALAIDFAHNILYYGSGTNHYFGTEYRGMGMFKSTNDGASWTQINFGLPQQTQIYKIAIDPNDNTGNTIYIAEFNGLFKTTDGGSSWSKILPASGSLMCTDVCFSPNGSKVYAVGTAENFWPGTPFNGIGYYRSSNGGANWTQVTSSSGFPHSSIPHGRSCLAVSNEEEDYVYIFSYDNTGSNPLYFYKSTNGGIDFSSYHYPYIDESDNWNLGGNAGFNQTINCSDFDANIIIVGFQNLYRTTNGGSNWACIGGYCTGHNPHADFHAVDFNPFSQDKIIVGGDGGVHKSDNLGSSWTGLNSEIGLAQVWNVGSNVYNSEELAAGIEDQDLAYRQTGTDWYDNFLYYDGGLAYPSPFKGGRYIGNTCANTAMYYSTNSGINFSGVSNYLYGSSTGSWVALVENHPSIPGTSFLVRSVHYQDLQYRHHFSPVHFLKTTDYGANFNGGSNVSFSHEWINVAPNALTISQSNPDLMIMTIGNGSTYWHQADNAYSRLLKSTDGGNTWNVNNPLLICDGSVVPDRFVTNVVIDPINEDEIYITLSGYDAEHVYRTTNGGLNWADIDGDGASKLPNNPTNDLIIHYTSSNTKEIIVACDVGVFRTDASTIGWSVLTDGLPNAPVMNLDYNRLSGKLNVATVGRGVWQMQLDQSTIYVQDRLYITDNVTLNKPIVVSEGGKLVIGHSSVNSSMTINFNNGADITVEEGGTLLANSNVAVTLSSTGSWNGVVVNGNYSNCVLKNCTFSNTSTPLVISASPSSGIPPTPEFGVIIEDCHFTNAPVEVTGRKDVTIKYSDWTMSTSAGLEAIVASGAENLYLLYNDINYTSQVSGSHAIQVSQSDNSTISRSTISNCDYPITVSNGTYYIRYSDISTTSASTSVAGIYLNGVNYGHLIANEVSGYQMGYQLVNSTPGVLLNIADGSNSNGNKSAIYCDGSSPVMFPTVTKTEVIWDGGLNNLRNDATNGVGLFNTTNGGDPKLDYGYNTIVGDINIKEDYPFSTWYVRCNSWENNPPVFNTGVTMEYLPTDCTPPDSRPFSPNEPRSGSEKENTDNIDNIEIPPQPLIVDYGNGLIDTFNVATLSIEVTTDVELLGDGNKEMYLNNFQDAIDIFKTVVQNYQDSTTALVSLNRIFYCYDRMNADSSSYNTLISYFNNLASSNNTDTFFVKTVNELSRKCLVKQRNYITAINAYEDVVENSNDPSEILAAEISIIEIYVMMNSGSGDAMSYTGRYSSLKPIGLRDAMRMIREKMGHSNNQLVTNLIPKQFSLSQNYPNPFNPLTTIKYAIPNNTKVTLKVYDILGKLIRTLVNEYKNAGNYSVSFDGSSLASGVYFYKIEAGTFVQSKKMVLVK